MRKLAILGKGIGRGFEHLLALHLCDAPRTTRRDGQRNTAQFLPAFVMGAVPDLLGAMPALAPTSVLV